MDKVYRTAEQECHSCGKHFYLKYHSDGTYEYVEEVCDCDTDFSPVEGELSISEWLEYLKNIE